MMPMFKTKGTKRRNELKDLLGRDVVHGKDYFHQVWRYFRQHCKIILITLLLLFSFIRYIFYYNSFVVLHQKVINARAQIETTLQMRQNIIPALTIVVYQFINHENNIFLKTVEARGNPENRFDNIEVLKKSVRNLSNGSIPNGVLTKFIAVAENYPQLVTSQAYQLLIGQISETEKQIYEKRLEYNNEVNIYNTKLSIFPDNAVGLTMGFRIQPYFEWDTGPEWVFNAIESQGELPMSMETKKQIEETRKQ